MKDNIGWPLICSVLNVISYAVDHDLKDNLEIQDLWNEVEAKFDKLAKNIGQIYGYQTLESFVDAFISNEQITNQRNDSAKLYLYGIIARTQAMAEIQEISEDLNYDQIIDVLEKMYETLGDESSTEDLNNIIAFPKPKDDI